MNLILIYKIFFFSLVPVGIYCFFLFYRLYKKIFKGKILVELFLDKKEDCFVLPSSGYYSIWQRGEYLKQTFVNKYRPQITNVDTLEVVELRTSYMAPRTNNFKKAEMELFWFKASEGNYKLEFIEGRMIGRFESALTIPFASVPYSDQSKYSIQVRESLFPGSSILYIFLFLFSFFCVLGGIVFGSMADKLFA